MLYETINPYTEELVKTFPQHTDAQLESIIRKAGGDLHNRLEPEIARGTPGRYQEGRFDFCERKSTNSLDLSRSKWASCFARHSGRSHLAQTFSTTMPTARISSWHRRNSR